MKGIPFIMASVYRIHKENLMYFNTIRNYLILIIPKNESLSILKCANFQLVMSHSHKFDGLMLVFKNDGRYNQRKACVSSSI